VLVAFVLTLAFAMTALPAASAPSSAEVERLCQSSDPRDDAAIVVTYCTRTSDMYDKLARTSSDPAYRDTAHVTVAVLAEKLAIAYTALGNTAKSRASLAHARSILETVARNGSSADTRSLARRYLERLNKKSSR
jgi:hypothetical protein